jgi:small conductance mechanosensitive channel
MQPRWKVPADLPGAPTGVPPCPPALGALLPLALAGLFLPLPWQAAGAQVEPDTVPAAEGVREEFRLSEEGAALQAGMRDLLAIYRRMDGLSDVRIHLEGGILEISGTALSQEARTTAVEVAERVLPGVVWVDNRLEVETDLRKRLAPAWERMEEKTVAFVRFLPTLLVGLALVAGAVLLAVWTGRRSFPYDRLTGNAFARSFLRQVVRTVIVLMGVILALDLMGATALVGAVLGAAGLLGIAVGFAFRDIVENYLAGVLLSLRQPFAPNDHLQLAGQEGRVARLTGRETILMTLDGNHVRIPNAIVYKEVMTNFTRNPRRRFMVAVSVAPWEDVGRALTLGKNAVRALPGVLDQPVVSGRIQEIGDSSVQLRIFGWVDQSRADFGKVRSEALRAVKEAYEREGVATPPPEYGIRILEGAGADLGPAGLEKDFRPTPGAAAPDGPPHPPRPRHAELPEETADVSPDTTIEEEIARERAESEEEDLLRHPTAEARGARRPE